MRSLKYARKYLHVEAMLWGPVTQVNTGFVALQNITDRVVSYIETFSHQQLMCIWQEIPLIIPQYYTSVTLV